ncbi:hypothetical protein Acr_11g0012700 [Actinidia rufa]|uniref:SHSP domain-containing protein n=1 Tax=Actinidia rufa TaxID=165716 RepID=A0A7J0FE40_9ERIC|nr:hypothetical protein Acr_11g0012700 [Actinidia rufa]
MPSGIGSSLVQAAKEHQQTVGELGTFEIVRQSERAGQWLQTKEEEEEEERNKTLMTSNRVAMSYGYYDTTILLSEDAKVDEIKAEMKDGMLTIFIPRTEAPKKDVKEIQIK